MKALQYEGLVNKIARKYLWAVGPVLDKEDLLQEGRLAAWLHRDNPKGWVCSNVSAAGFAARGAIYDYAMEMAQAVRLPPRERGREAFKAGVGRRVHPDIMYFIPCQAPEPTVLPARIRAAWESLDERERFILRQVFVEDRELADIGREMGISRERVRQLHVRALRKLRPVGGNNAREHRTR